MNRALIIGVVIGATLFACGRTNETAQPQQTTTAAAPAFTGPMRDECFRVKWDVANAPSTMKANTVVPLDVTITNVTECTWPDVATADPKKDGSYAVRLSHRWNGKDLGKLAEYTARYDLPSPLGPGQSATIHVLVNTPPSPGQYRLQVDAVQELMAFFEWKGAQTWIHPVTVQ